MWSHRLTVRTVGFQSTNRGSIPRGTANFSMKLLRIGKLNQEKPAIIDSNGIIISKLESTKKGVIEINNYKKFNETLFSKFGNKIFFYILLFYISLIFFINRWENK